jgi:hypothetical protein
LDLSSSYMHNMFIFTQLLFQIFIVLYVALASFSSKGLRTSFMRYFYNMTSTSLVADKFTSSYSSRVIAWSTWWYAMPLKSLQLNSHFIVHKNFINWLINKLFRNLLQSIANNNNHHITNSSPSSPQFFFQLLVLWFCKETLIPFNLWSSFCSCKVFKVGFWIGFQCTCQLLQNLC